MVYTWRTSSLTLAEARDLAKHITHSDWQILFEKDAEFYITCCEVNGWVHVDALSDDFIREHYYLLVFSDIDGIASNQYSSVYDWLRSERPHLFTELEDKLLLKPHCEPGPTDINDEVKSWLDVKEGAMKNKLPPAPNCLVRRSRYYGYIKSSELEAMIAKACDDMLINGTHLTLKPELKKQGRRK